MKLLFRPMSLLASVLGGMIAGAIFKKIWKGIAGEDEAPSPEKPDRNWKEIASAAALQGAVAGGVRAMVDRGALKGFEKATGVWPAKT